jgi:hypothetical protein
MRTLVFSSTCIGANAGGREQGSKTRRQRTDAEGAAPVDKQETAHNTLCKTGKWCHTHRAGPCRGSRRAEAHHSALVDAAHKHRNARTILKKKKIRAQHQIPQGTASEKTETRDQSQRALRNAAQEQNSETPKHQPEAASRNRNQEPNGKDSATWTTKTQGRAQSAQANDEDNTNDEDNSQKFNPPQLQQQPPLHSISLHRASIAPSRIPPIPATIQKYHASY